MRSRSACPPLAQGESGPEVRGIRTFQPHKAALPSALPLPLWQRACAALVLCAAIFLQAPAIAQTFPALSGRVVDAANLLNPDQRAAIAAKLKTHEDKTSDQLVVATVPSLEGYEVEDYANRLFRTWKLGAKDKNNGVLLIVAPKERKVRIEVGYGLEGALTDALSKVIISTAIAPQFQKGDFAGGIDAGVDAILSILTGDAEEWQRRAQVRSDEANDIESIVPFIVYVILVIIIVRALNPSGGRGVRRGRAGPWIIPTGGGWSGGGWSGGSGGGGFSGGGGSSGGGGASGSW